jgi:hypothetical protein
MMVTAMSVPRSASGPTQQLAGPPRAPMAHRFEQMDIAPVRVQGRFWSGSK